MLKKPNKKVIFIGGTILFSLLAALCFEFLINKIFPQPSFFFSHKRFSAVAILTSAAIYLIKYHQYFCDNLDKAFLLISLSFGISSILVFPQTVYLSPDDQIHFRNSYFFMSDTLRLRGGFSAIESRGLVGSTGKGFDEMAAVYNAINEYDKIIIDEQYHPSDSPQLYSRIAYLPFYLGFKVSDFLHLNFTTAIIVSKTFNLLCYILLIYFAIRYSGKFRKIFFIIGLLLGNIYLATQFSYDPLVIASMLLAIGLFLHIRQTKEASPQYLLAFILISVVGCLSKAVYCPILLLALMIPNSNFDCKRRAIAFKACSILIMIVLAATFVLPILGGSLASDLRGGHTSVSGQIQFLLNNPLKAILVAITFLAGKLPDLIFSTVGQFGAAASIYDACAPFISLVGMSSLLVMLWATFSTDLSETTITSRSKVGFAAIYGILVGAIAMSMYLSFTEVGAMHISGIQPRYMMPILPLFLIILMPKGQPKSPKLQLAKKTCDKVTLFVPYLCLMLILAVYILRTSRL